MGQETIRAERPEQVVYLFGLGFIGTVQVYLTVLRPGFIGQAAGELQACRGLIAAQNIEVDIGHGAPCRIEPGNPSLSLSAQAENDRLDDQPCTWFNRYWVSKGTGRPVAPFSLPPLIHAVPAISRCAHGYALVKRDR